MNGPRSKCREQTLIGAASHTVISHTYRNLFSFMCASRFLYKQSSSTSLIGLHNYCTILKIVAQASKFLLLWKLLSYSYLFHTIGSRSERAAVCSTPYTYTCRSWKKSFNLQYAPKKSVQTFSVPTGTSSVLLSVLPRVLLLVLTVQYD